MTPANPKTKGVELMPNVGAEFADPAVGVPAHGLAPVPVTAIFTGELRLPPEIDTLPEYADMAEGLKYTGTVAPDIVPPEYETVVDVAPDVLP